MARPLLGDTECDAVAAVLRSGQLAQGKVVQQFEERFAALCGVSHAVAASSGTTALHLALLAHGIGAGDEVITPSFSFVATANVALYVGATPVFADIDPRTLNIDPDDVEAKITPRTRAVIAVHLYGNPAGLGRLTDICERHSLVLIEDACQAHAATYRGRPVGSFGTGCFSFYPTKNLTSGEGGMLTTNDAAVAERARLLRAHGMPQRYVHEILGYNFRMTDVHAAIGLAQFDRLSEWTDQRICNAGTLRRLMEHLPIEFQATDHDATHVYHQFTVRIPEYRDEVTAHLRREGIGCEVYYPIPIHQQPLYRDLGFRDFLPESERAAREVLSLPVHPSLTGDELRVIARTVRQALVEARQLAHAAD
jgi:dTDP-4-amino-4,6-dideoxygalactose transaminase